MVEYSAPWSRFLKIVSAAVTVLLLVAFWFSSAVSTMEASAGFQIFLYVLPVLLLGTSAVFIIRRYELAEDQLTVVRFVGRVSYALSDFERVEHDPEATAMSMRTFGNGGLYSYSGFFRNSTLGRYRAFMTDRSNAVVLYRRNGSPVVISPENPNEFVAEINSRL